MNYQHVTESKCAPGGALFRCSVFIILLLCVIFYSCDIDPTSEPVTRDELIGTYRPNYEAGDKEFIILKSDSSYIHYFKSIEGNEYTDTSYWDLIYEIDDTTRPRLRLRNFVDRYPLQGHAFSRRASARLDTMPHGWMPYIYKSGEKIIIERDPSVKQYYIKIGQDGIL